MSHCVYVSVASEDKILRFSLNAETGGLSPLGETDANGSPGPLAVNPEQTRLYAGRRGAREISTYGIDRATGDLSLLGTVSLEADPCYLSTDRKGRFLLSAYYGAGVAAVHALDENGVAAGQPVVWRETARKAHCILTDPSNRYAFVPHVGESNAIFQFTFDENSGALTPNAVPKVTPPEGTGPRHFVFHPNLDMVYVSNEQGSSVTACNFHTSAGTLEPVQTLSTLPDGFDGDNTCAQIHIHPSGNFLYVSNRGHDSIACFSIDGSGGLASLGQQPTEPVPRAFGVDPTGNFLFAGGQPSGKLASYRIDPGAGTLAPLKTYSVGQQSMWVLFLPMQG